MIKAYVSGIASPYEGEDIEVRYAIFEDSTLIAKEFMFMNYRKPATVGAVALLRVLKVLEKYKQQEITFFLNEPALCEFLNGTGTTKNVDIQKLVREIDNELNKFEHVIFKDVSRSYKELEEWNEILRG